MMAGSPRTGLSTVYGLGLAIVLATRRRPVSTLPNLNTRAADRKHKLTRLYDSRLQGRTESCRFSRGFLPFARDSPNEAAVVRPMIEQLDDDVPDRFAFQYGS